MKRKLALTVTALLLLPQMAAIAKRDDDEKGKQKDKQENCLLIVRTPNKDVRLDCQRH